MVNMCEIIDGIIEEVKQYMDCKGHLPRIITLGPVEYKVYLKERKTHIIHFTYHGDFYKLPMCRTWK